MGLDIRAADIAQMHVIDFDRAGGHAGLTRQAAIEMVDGLGVGGPALLEHCLDQIDPPKRTIVFVPGQNVGWARGGTETVMHAIPKDFGSLNVSRLGELPFGKGRLHRPVFSLRVPARSCLSNQS